MGTSMLAPTVSHGKSEASWNIIATRWAPTSTAPSEGSSRPATRESSVLLPQPEAPTIARNSPTPTATLIPSMAVTAPLPPPKVLVTSVIWTASVRVGVWVAMVMGATTFQPGHRLAAVLGEDRVERVEGVDSGQVGGVEQTEGRGPLRSGEQRGRDRVDREGDVVEGGGGQLRTEPSPGDLLHVLVGDHLCFLGVVVDAVDTGDVALEQGLDVLGMTFEVVRTDDQVRGDVVTVAFRPQVGFVDEQLGVVLGQEHAQVWFGEPGPVDVTAAEGVDDLGVLPGHDGDRSTAGGVGLPSLFLGEPAQCDVLGAAQLGGGQGGPG